MDAGGSLINIESPFIRNPRIMYVIYNTIAVKVWAHLLSHC